MRARRTSDYVLTYIGCFGYLLFCKEVLLTKVHRLSSAHTSIVICLISPFALDNNHLKLHILWCIN